MADRRSASLSSTLAARAGSTELPIFHHDEASDEDESDAFVRMAFRVHADFTETERVLHTPGALPAPHCTPERRARLTGAISSIMGGIRRGGLRRGGARVAEPQRGACGMLLDASGRACPAALH